MQKNINTEELIENIEDTIVKLQDCAQSIKEGKELDPTQLNFIKGLNIT